jgi:exoribonuclease R
VNVRFTKSVISSKAAFTYEEAQIRKDDPLVLHSVYPVDPFTPRSH